MVLKDSQVLGTAIGCLWAEQDLRGQSPGLGHDTPRPEETEGRSRVMEMLTWGKARCRGSQQLNATMPARGWGQVSAV